MQTFIHYPWKHASWNTFHIVRMLRFLPEANNVQNGLRYFSSNANRPDGVPGGNPIQTPEGQTDQRMGMLSCC